MCRNPSGKIGDFATSPFRGGSVRTSSAFQNDSFNKGLLPMYKKESRISPTFSSMRPQTHTPITRYSILQSLKKQVLSESTVWQSALRYAHPFVAPARGDVGCADRGVPTLQLQSSTAVGAPQEDFLRCCCAPPPGRSRHEAAENQWKRTLFRS